MTIIVLKVQLLVYKIIFQLHSTPDMCMFMVVSPQNTPWKFGQEAYLKSTQ